MGVNNMKTMKWLTAVMVLLVAVLAMASVSAQVVSIDEVKVNGDALSSISVLNLERGESLDVKVIFTALEDAEEIAIDVSLHGYEDGPIDAYEYVDEINLGSTYVERLTLDLPYDMDQLEDYTLRVRVMPRSGDAVTIEHEFEVEAVEHGVIIRDVVFAPGQTVEAGRALLTTVRVENIGDEDEDDGIKVQVALPELGLVAVDYIDEVDEDDQTTSEELYLRIPSTVAAGDYDAVVTVWYDDMDEKVSQTYSIEVVNNAQATAAVAAPQEPSKTVITVGPENQQVSAGQGGAVYPVTLTNAAGEAKTYVVNVDGFQAWGTARVDPSNVLVVAPGETKAAYIFVSANEGVAGQQPFTVEVTSNGESLRELVLMANVVSPAPGAEATGWESVKRGLEVGLFILVILVLILGLIIAVNKLKSNGAEEEDDATQTYY
jgi:hypothetical protein